jgi:hypothetical protein
MGTLLNEVNYNQLRLARKSLIHKFGEAKIAGIHLPWAGGQLLEPSDGKLSIYLIGSAPARNYASGIHQSFNASLDHLEKGFREEPEFRKHTPFWRFLSGLTKHFFGKSHYDCFERWGWSNLFKIAYNEGCESKWPDLLFQMQKAACARALATEFKKLQGALIFVGSNSDHGLLQETLPRARFDKTYECDGVHYWSDEQSGNLYVWGYHPNAAQRGKFFDSMLKRTIYLAAQG